MLKEKEEVKGKQGKNTKSFKILPKLNLTLKSKKDENPVDFTTTNNQFFHKNNT